MNGAVLVGVVSLVVVASVGLAAVVASPRWREPSWWRSTRHRASVVLDTGVEQLGRLVTALVVVLAGGGLVVAVLWLVGWPIKLTEQSLDVPVYEWWVARVGDAPGWWSRSWLTLTNIGGLTQTQTLTAVFAVALAVLWRVLWRRRQWWVPLVVLPVGYVLEKTLQDLLKLVVDRGHPPTTLGSFPSGGCARVVLVYGLIVFLLLWGARVRDRRVWVAGGAFVALCATIQAYARTFNLEHWVTDVAAGLVFGLMLLVTMVLAVVVLDREAPHRDVPRSAAPRRGDAASRRREAASYDAPAHTDSDGDDERAGERVAR